MNQSKPFLRRAFDRVERTLGEPLEELVASKTFTEVMLRLTKVQRAIGGAVADAASGAVEKVLHVVQIPTRSDVRRLNRQIVELASEIRGLSAKLQQTSRSRTSGKVQRTQRHRKKRTASDGD